MEEIKRINDKIFKKTFGNPENVKLFLNIALPEKLKNKLDFTSIEIDPTNYVSDEFKDFFSDLIIKTKLNSKEKKIPADIYFLFEHKTEVNSKIFVQILKYMYLEWQKDVHQKDPLRIILPLVFYHGKKKWNLPHSFSEQFDVDDDIKEFLLNYKYILFDTEFWDFHDESNIELRENIFLLSSMVLMKCAYNDDIDSIYEIFKFWHKKGYIKNKEAIIFFLTYISETKEINKEKLIEMLEKSHIDGGEIMPTLAQQFREEGREIGIKEGVELGKKEGVELGKKEGVEIGKREGVELGKKEGVELGKKEGVELGKKEGVELGKKETITEFVKKSLKAGLPLNLISQITGLSENELNKLEHANSL